MVQRLFKGRILSVSHCNLHSETQTQSSFYMWIVFIISPPPGANTFKYSSVNTEGIHSVFLKCIIWTVGWIKDGNLLLMGVISHPSAYCQSVSRQLGITALSLCLLFLRATFGLQQKHLQLKYLNQECIMIFFCFLLQLISNVHQVHLSTLSSTVKKTVFFYYYFTSLSLIILWAHLVWKDWNQKKS